MQLSGLLAIPAFDKLEYDRHRPLTRTELRLFIEEYDVSDLWGMVCRFLPSFEQMVTISKFKEIVVLPNGPEFLRELFGLEESSARFLLRQ
ncbi:hypothetical protein Y032_0021g383 [Ancylostoma ceylanicum]|uniref:Uncharacterized protein n=1 Tax=Ancylostoma ceylanicum TaxID=53326 RepID=A0A016UZ61_9BILA|nr:hypothetical protein Y032_0021g383 [Ancylostoma ceylanicum]